MRTSNDVHFDLIYREVPHPRPGKILTQMSLLLVASGVIRRPRASSVRSVVVKNQQVRLRAKARPARWIVAHKVPASASLDREPLRFAVAVAREEERPGVAARRCNVVWRSVQVVRNNAARPRDRRETADDAFVLLDANDRHCAWSLAVAESVKLSRAPAIATRTVQESPFAFFRPSEGSSFAGGNPLVELLVQRRRKDGGVDYKFINDHKRSQTITPNRDEARRWCSRAFRGLVGLTVSDERGDETNDVLVDLKRRVDGWNRCGERLHALALVPYWRLSLLRLPRR